MNILIVEDDPVAAELLLGVLEAEGHHDVVAGNGARALDALRIKHLSLVISDTNA